MWAYLGLMIGGAISIGANIAHSMIPPRGAEPGWAPEVGAVILSMSWPVLLLVGVEIMTRVDWPDSTRWTLLRWVGLLPVALVAAVVSYRHMSGLMSHYGEDHVTSALGPVGIDGLMVMSSAALLATMSPPAEPVSSTMSPPAEPVSPPVELTIVPDDPVSPPVSPPAVTREDRIRWAMDDDQVRASSEIAQRFAVSSATAKRDRQEALSRRMSG